MAGYARKEERVAFEFYCELSYMETSIVDGTADPSYHLLKIVKELKETIAKESKRTTRLLTKQGKHIGKLIITCDGHGKALKQIMDEKLKESPSGTGILRLVACTSSWESNDECLVYHNGRILNGKLDFGLEDDEVLEWSEVRQEELGAPFTYGTHDENYAACETPWTTKRNGVLWSRTCCGTYIFADDLNKREQLVADEHCMETREMLHSLMPGQPAKQDVIDMVVGKMTHHKDSNRWFLPTIFLLRKADYRIVDYIRERYMGKFDDVSKVYVPLVRNQH
ncbi:hypothetical protein PIB30_048941 [Stylosanthes scabra]|uniref:Uncharacterized protein n=1 Tax=Stylosanthes scabra TaxID=79078 RepID=A0ABU6ZFX4_9FABA|nr:hypothetical protein [Stylosanthes scabra]